MTIILHDLLFKFYFIVRVILLTYIKPIKVMLHYRITY